MGAETFLRRWARRKTDDATGPVPAQNQATENAGPGLPSGAQSVAEPSASPLPTIEDVARLTPDSDYSAFVAKGVDKTVQRLAMKKLFSDPHFNIMDGLDIYIDDYNQAGPIPAAMLASLKQAESFLDRPPAVDDAGPEPSASLNKPQESRDEQAGTAADGSTSKTESARPGGTMNDVATHLGQADTSPRQDKRDPGF